MELITNRLRLREYQREDVAQIYDYQRKPLYLRYYAWQQRELADVRTFVEMFLAQQQATPRIKFQLTIELRDSNLLIGSCGIRRKGAGAHEADIGYELDPDYWGQGYATEAATEIVRFGFEQLGLHRISSWCVADNVGSARVLEKIGMRQEGRLRDHEFYKGRYWDTLLYALLEHEFDYAAAGGGGLHGR